VHVAANDRGRPFGGGRLGDGCLDELPVALAQGPGGDAIRLIDVAGTATAAFEVEH
jgi:type II restriction enzyme